MDSEKYATAEFLLFYSTFVFYVAPYPFAPTPMITRPIFATVHYQMAWCVVLNLHAYIFSSVVSLLISALLIWTLIHAGQQKYIALAKGSVVVVVR